MIFLIFSGTRLWLHRGNTVTECTINFGRNSSPVYYDVPVCLHLEPGQREWGLK